MNIEIVNLSYFMDFIKKNIDHVIDKQFYINDLILLAYKGNCHYKVNGNFIYFSYDYKYDADVDEDYIKIIF